MRIERERKMREEENQMRAEAQRKGINIAKTRWIDINKGDDKNPVYRSRFVAKEFNSGEAQGLFAGTPPLWAFRALLSSSRTKGRSPKELD